MLAHNIGLIQYRFGITAGSFIKRVCQVVGCPCVRCVSRSVGERMELGVDTVGQSQGAVGFEILCLGEFEEQ